MTFQRGDHLRVRRNVYFHHGIYVSKDRVTAFGGGTLFDKAHAVVEPVSLREFERGGAAVVVRHPHPMNWLHWFPDDPLPPDAIVARAEHLLAQAKSLE